MSIQTQSQEEKNSVSNLSFSSVFPIITLKNALISCLMFAPSPCPPLPSVSSRLPLYPTCQVMSKPVSHLA